MNKKKILILSLIIIFLSIIIYVYYGNNKKIDIDSLKERLLLEYDEVDLLDRDDISMCFGIESDLIPSSFFISDFKTTTDNYLFEPNNLVIVINSKEKDYYYGILRSFLDSNINNRDNTNNLSLYTNAVLKKKKNLVYLILGSKNEKIEKIINNYL